MIKLWCTSSKWTYLRVYIEKLEISWICKEHLVLSLIFNSLVYPGLQRVILTSLWRHSSLLGSHFQLHIRNLLWSWRISSARQRRMVSDHTPHSVLLVLNSCWWIGRELKTKMITTFKLWILTMERTFYPASVLVTTTSLCSGVLNKVCPWERRQFVELTILIMRPR